MCWALAVAFLWRAMEAQAHCAGPLARGWPCMELATWEPGLGPKGGDAI